MAKFGREGWQAVVAAGAAGAVLVTPTPIPQSWYVAVPLWGFTAWSAWRWWRVGHDSTKDVEGIIDVTPARIVEPFGQMTTIQAQAIFRGSFKGKRIVVKGTVGDVSKLGSPGFGYTVRLREYGYLGKSKPNFILFGFSARHGRNLNHLGAGEKVQIVGTITDASEHSLTLMNCRLELDKP